MKILIDENKKQYKANLHCHSTCSDGRLSPEKLKEEYKKRGYSVLAITDHEHLVEHHDLTDDDFLMLTAYEMFVFTLPSDHNENSTSHLNLYSKTPHNKMLYYSPEIVYSRYIRPEERPVACHAEKATREHTVEFVKQLVKDAKEAGYLVCHCHPTWSFEDESFADAFEDCFAMELYNHSSYSGGFFEYNQHYYDVQTKKGRRMGVMAVDDNHDFFPIGHPHNDSFGGVTYILAEKLDYASVMQSLENKDFYASTGPIIHSLTFDGGTFHARTSDAERIIFVTNTRNRAITIAPENESVNEYWFNLGETDKWVRLEVVDKEGKRAFSRAYFRDELI